MPRSTRRRRRTPRSRRRRKTPVSKARSQAGKNRAIYEGRKVKGSTMTPSRLRKNKHGRIVSSKKSNLGKKNPWIRAVTAARRQLGITGFQVVRKGTRLYRLAKQIQARLQ